MTTLPTLFTNITGLIISRIAALNVTISVSAPGLRTFKSAITPKIP